MLINMFCFGVSGFPVLKNFSLNIQSEFTNWNEQLPLLIMHLDIREAREYVIKYLEIKNWQLDRLSLSFTVNNEISVNFEFNLN